MDILSDWNAGSSEAERGQVVLTRSFLLRDLNADDHVCSDLSKVVVSSLANSLTGMSVARSVRKPTRVFARSWRAVIAVLLCIFLRWRTNLHRAPVHRAAADTSLETKDGYAVRAILPLP